MLVHAIQDQAVKTRYIENNIYKTTENDKCRKCNEKAETIHHITSGCPKYANTLYLKRHNNVAKYLHLKICLNSDLVKKNCEWYKYEPLPVLENENFKILWDFSIQTDREIRAPGGTLNVEVIGILIRNVLENPKKYPDFDSKPLKKYPNCNF